MVDKNADIYAEDFNEIMADGDYIADEITRAHFKKGDLDFVVVRYAVYKYDDYICDVDVWSLESPPPPGTEVTAIPNAPKGSENWQDGEIGQIDVVDANGNLAGSLGGGLGVSPSDFVAGTAKGVSSELRYAVWVSLFDGDLTVTGTSHDDTRIEVGTGGLATVNTGKGSDSVRVWQQKDIVFNGGKGVDGIAFVKGMDITPIAAQGAVVDLTTGTGTNPFGGTLTLINVENVTGVDNKANDLRGNGKANKLTGGIEADTIKGEGGNDTIAIQSYFSATARAVVVDGGTGNDTLIAYLGTNGPFTSSPLLYTNTLDLLTPANNTGTFNGATFAGIEIYEARGGTSYLAFDFHGSDNGEAARGSDGTDTLDGRGGNDTLRGGEGADTLDGGDGRDVADYSDNNFFKIVAKINGASTTITVNGVQQDTLIGIEGAKGGNANDKLTGDGGANEFDGSLGKDTLTGKGGKDHFVFSTELGGTNVDTLKDFKPGADKIDLDDGIFAKLGPDISKGEFLKVSSGHAAKQSDDRLIYNKTDGTLWFDDDGTGKHAAVKFAVLTGSPDTISFHDFHIV